MLNEIAHCICYLIDWKTDQTFQKEHFEVKITLILKKSKYYVYKLVKRNVLNIQKILFADVISKTWNHLIYKLYVFKLIF